MFGRAEVREDIRKLRMQSAGWALVEEMVDWLLQDWTGRQGLFLQGFLTHGEVLASTCRQVATVGWICLGEWQLRICSPKEHNRNPSGRRTTGGEGGSGLPTLGQKLRSRELGLGKRKPGGQSSCSLHMWGAEAGEEADGFCVFQGCEDQGLWLAGYLSKPGSPLSSPSFSLLVCRMRAVTRLQHTAVRA